MKKPILLFLAFFLAAVPALAEAPHMWISGFKYYPLVEACQEKGIYYEWDPVGRVVRLTKNGVEAKLRVGSDNVLVDGERMIDIGPPVYFCNETVVIPSSFFGSTASSIFKAKRPSQPAWGGRNEQEGQISHNAIRRIIIDPGHGGKDPGATSSINRVEEKNVNLDMAKRLRALLAENGIEADLTRETDVFLPLEERAAIANEKSADLFICMHSNASRDRNLCGLEVYYLSEKKVDDSARALKAARNSAPVGEGTFLEKCGTDARAIVYDLMFTENRVDSKRLAQCIVDSARRKNIYTRWNSMKDANFHVLRNFKTDMPAVLVEIGYLTNRKEEGLICTEEYRDRIAQAIVNAIMTYKKEYEKQEGFSH